MAELVFTGLKLEMNGENYSRVKWAMFELMQFGVKTVEE